MTSDCVLWGGSVDRDGYGKAGKKLAHRVAWERDHGPIPAGLTVDHRCFVKLCVNTGHMRLLTRLENQRNQRSAFKTHCVNGHEFTPANTRARTRAGRQRACRACAAADARKYRARLRSHA